MPRLLSTATLALALLHPACVSLAPAEAEQRLRARLAQRAACTDAACTAAAESKLLQLAERSVRAAERERDLPRRMALLRIGGVAAWQAGSEGAGLAEQAAHHAVARCRLLDEISGRGVVPGAPDDCVVLEVLPALVAHAAYARELAQLAAAAPDDDAAFALERSVADYPTQTLLLLRDIAPRLREYGGVRATTLSWLDDTQRALLCDYARARELAEAQWPERAELQSRVTRELLRAAAAMRSSFERCADAPAVSPPPDR